MTWKIAQQEGKNEKKYRCRLSPPENDIQKNSEEGTSPIH